MQSSIGGGQRSDSATAYLHPVENRTNLDILINTQVTRLISYPTINPVPAFRKVEMAQSSKGEEGISAKTERELISCWLF